MVFWVSDSGLWSWTRLFWIQPKGELRVNPAVFELFALKSQTLVFVKTVLSWQNFPGLGVGREVLPFWTQTPCFLGWLLKREIIPALRALIDLSERRKCSAPTMGLLLTGDRQCSLVQFLKNTITVRAN
jgi:hypothetical protein